MGWLNSLSEGAGAALGGLFGFGSGVASNVASARQAEKQMAFQERMSSTAHQRQVADMRKAGLNPILSATGGKGASSPVGAMAQIKDPTHSALDAMRFKQEISNLNARTNQAYSQDALLNQQIRALEGNVKYQSLYKQFLNSPRGKLWFETQMWLPQVTSAVGAGTAALGLKRLKTLTKTKSGGKGFKPASFNKSTGEIK